MATESSLSARPLASAGLVVFAGQSCTRESHGETLGGVAAAVRRAAASCGLAIGESHLCFAPAVTDIKWAVYSPTLSEVEAHGGDWWAAERSTCTVPHLSADLYRSAAGAWDLVEGVVERCGRVLLVGCSNGAIPATEFATSCADKFVALLLFSGLPASAQQRRVADGLKACPPVSLTLGSRERYFGGRAIFEGVARSLHAELVPFTGGHCGEDSATVVSATRSAVLRALFS